MTGWLKMRMRIFERRALIRILIKSEGNIKMAARIAGRNRSYIHKQCAYHGIDPVLYRPVKEKPKHKTRPKASATRARAQARELVDADVVPSNKKPRSYFGVPVS